MVIGRRLETALAFFVGLALGIMCTLHNKILEAQEKKPTTDCLAGWWGAVETSLHPERVRTTPVAGNSQLH